MTIEAIKDANNAIPDKFKWIAIIILGVLCLYFYQDNNKLTQVVIDKNEQITKGMANCDKLGKKLARVEARYNQVKSENKYLRDSNQKQLIKIDKRLSQIEPK